MATTTCENCGSTYIWHWEEAFDKFGFNDGDGDVQTYEVADILEAHGYQVEYIEWSLHNTIIDSIKKNGIELIPETANTGYDDPRGYLPEDIIALLDEEFG